MTKLLLLLLVVAVALWWLSGRRRVPPPQAPDEGAPTAAPPRDPQTMLACVHCGVHLPVDDAVIDAAGRPFCSEAHRLAGPR